MARPKKTTQAITRKPASSRESLRDAAIREAAERSESRSWVGVLKRTNPALLEEVMGIVREWIEHGEIRTSYPTANQLASFLSKHTPVKMASLRNYLKKAEENGIAG